MKKRLALGHQEFSEVIGKECIYVDKTPYLLKLIQEGTYYFLSRPRRFGKSLLCNTLKELFLSNKELFRGLWIYDKYDWGKKNPVIKISFAKIDYYAMGLVKAISLELDNIASEYSIRLQNETIATKFEELIKKTANNGQVAIIIDEYDKPIVDYLTDISKAEENRDILQNFFSIIKDADKYIHFFFVTGVSKFSKVSIFSRLNNLVDLTLNKDYAAMIGWTEQELLSYFPQHIAKIRNTYKHIFPDIMREIRNWYNGYSWDGETKLYNPVSIMMLFNREEFGNYWFETGTPTFLMKLIREKKYTPKDIETSKISASILDKYEVNNVTLISLLFQTGYLTIKNKDLKTRKLTLGYPNQEVEEAFTKYFLSELSSGKVD